MTTSTATATAKPTTKAPRINKFLYLYVLQGFYAKRWEDLTASENRAEVRDDLKDYRENAAGSYRIIKRTEPNPEHVRKLIQTINHRRGQTMKTELNTPASRRLKAYKVSAAKLTESYKIYGNSDYVTTWQQQRYPKPDVLSRPDLTRSTDKQKYFVNSLDNFPCKKWIDAEKTGARDICAWYADNMQHELITPAVVFIRNPKALNDDDRDNAGAHIQFMPAIYWSDCDTATVYAEVYDCMHQAAHAANDYAAHEAETGREEDAKYRAEEDISDSRALIHEINRDALELIRELKAHPEGYTAPIFKAIKNTLNDLINQRAKAFKTIANREENYWNAVEY